MAENIQMYEIDGHHIRFKCCDNTLAILYNEYVPSMCTVCGKISSWHTVQIAKYYPNCGAEMDKN